MAVNAIEESIIAELETILQAVRDLNGRRVKGDNLKVDHDWLGEGFMPSVYIQHRIKFTTKNESKVSLPVFANSSGRVRSIKLLIKKAPILSLKLRRFRKPILSISQDYIGGEELDSVLSIIQQIGSQFAVEKLNWEHEVKESLSDLADALRGSK
jgi:hypothetical protein